MAELQSGTGKPKDDLDEQAYVPEAGLGQAEAGAYRRGFR
jgi:hypothetical protein